MGRENFKKIIMGAGAVLIIFFFTLPLVQCVQDNSLTASGWEIATGTGDLYPEPGYGDSPAFLLLIIPAALLILAFLDKPFSMLRNVSAGGLLAKIIFVIIAHNRVNSGDMQGMLELTGFNWLVLVIYIGLCGFTHYCTRDE